MKLASHLLLLVAAIGLTSMTTSCGGGSKEPLIVMQNPATGEKAYFYRVNKYSAPHGYDQAKHIREWKAQEGERGFTEIVSEKTGE